MLNSPPLRRRKDDIQPLINHFLHSGPHTYLGRGKSIDEEAFQMMMKYGWPGNIRELQNVCERLQILSEGETITFKDLPDQIKNPDQKVIIDDYDPTIPLHELEKRYILKALNYFEGNKTQAANALGITIKTLYNKLHEYGEFERFSVHSRPKSM